VWPLPNPPPFTWTNQRASQGLDLIEQAAKRDARLVAFGETWLAGYPAWLDVSPGAALWENSSTKDVFARIRRNSLVVPGEEVNALSEAARDLKIAIVIGANERVMPVRETEHSTMRCSLFQRMDGSQTTIGSSSRPTRNGSCGEMVMAAVRSSAHFFGTRWWIDLLGALDAARAHGHAQLRRAHSRGGMADGP